MTLKSPEGTQVVLHDNDPNLPSTKTVELDDFNGQFGDGDWVFTLTWDPSTGERGFSNGWELNILGVALFSVTGRVVAIEGGSTNPVEGARVVLTGSNLIEQDFSSPQGGFSFSDLSENSFTLFISKFGYEQAEHSFRDTDEDIVNVGDIVLTPISSPEAILIAFPPVGTAPLFTSTL